MEDQAAGRGAGQVIPSEGDALTLHKKYGSAVRTVEHCRTVARVAKTIADEFARQGKSLDSRAVLAGALLHDIGRTKVQTARHGLDGSEILAKEGVDQKVVEIVRRHVGAGISAEEAKSLGLPPLDYIPRSLEETVVCFADKMVDADRVRPFDVEVQRFVRKGHDVERLRALKRGLQEDLGSDPESLVLGKIKESQ
ncbi:MAG: HDIG domain-containing protein [Nitrososphaerales archaeon]|nr:HDIG domain-containing protein [Nitrososphaerales archaeon]